jgi:glycosyltransferase involved in cell wall biosynthesis
LICHRSRRDDGEGMLFKVSVIIINYNKEKYIKQCIDSVLQQSLKEIEVIVIDDGSTDTSVHIIQEYAKTHANIKVFCQDNAGPGAARNRGLSLATGEYVAFLDADDLAESLAYEQLYLLAKAEGADTAIGNIKCFDEETEWTLSYMSKVFQKKLPIVRHITQNRELHATPSVSNKLFRRELLLHHEIQFDTNLTIGEDLLFTQRSLHESNKTVVKDIDVLRYRVLKKEESLSKKIHVSFFEQLVSLQQKLHSLYKELNIVDSLKKIEMRQLKFYASSIILKGAILTKAERVQICKYTKEFLNTITYKEAVDQLGNRDILMMHFAANSQYKEFSELIDIVSDERYSKEHIVAEGRIYSYLYQYFPKFKELLVVKEPQQKFRIEVLKLRGAILTIGGYAFIEGISTTEIRTELVFKNQHTTKVIPLVNSLRTDITYLFSKNTISYDYAGFETIDINLIDFLGNGNWEVSIRVKKENVIVEEPLHVLLAQLRNNVKTCMVNEKEIIPVYKDKTHLTLDVHDISPLKKVINKLKQKRRNIRYDVSFLKRRNFHTFFAILTYKVIGRLLRNRRIWLVGEREDTAQDNSYHLFKYIRAKQRRINAYYLIDKSSRDYAAIKELGNVIQFGSFRHTLFLLTCEKTINSYSEVANMYTDAYKKILKYYPEWQQNEKIFIQHGVIGVSRVNHVLHKNRMNYSKFVVSSEFEKNHIVREFGYKENEAIVTGLARWDALEDISIGNEILLMPTWRSWIKTREQLENSCYYKTYMSFLQSKELHRLLEEKDLTLSFFPHYQTQRLLGELSFFHERIKVLRQGEETVQNLLKRHRILITDYSTVSFDFAYMEKQVIFYQFDYDDFYSKHYNEGPINHKKDLFGERFENMKDMLAHLQKYEVGESRNENLQKRSMKYVMRTKLHCQKILDEIID